HVLPLVRGRRARRALSQLRWRAGGASPSARGQAPPASPLDPSHLQGRRVREASCLTGVQVPPEVCMELSRRNVLGLAATLAGASAIAPAVALLDPASAVAQTPK